MSREIELTRGQVATVDDDDYEDISRFKWYARWSPSTRSYYAQRMFYLEDGSQRAETMHRRILGLFYGDGKIGDHINCETLDNRRSNLRVASAAQNVMNSGARVNNRSGLKGVSRNRCGWMARIRINGKEAFLGYFTNPQDAHLAYCDAAKMNFGEFARVARRREDGR